MTNNPDDNSFIFFGCWNKYNCKIDTESNKVITSNPLSNVIIEIKSFMDELLDTSLKGIIDGLDLRRPIYFKTASYGHFGRDIFPWEKVVIK